MKNNSLVIEDLNQYLADLNVLYTKMHNFHWNVEGKSFFTLHVKLEEIYDALANEIDEVAERIIMIGGRPAASLKEYLAMATIKEVSSEGRDGDKIIHFVIEDFEAMLNLTLDIRQKADGNGDIVTVNMMDNAIANYQKNLWMMKAYLK